MTKTLQSIQKGIALLDQRRADLVAQPQEGADDGYADGDDWARAGGRGGPSPTVTGRS